MSYPGCGERFQGIEVPPFWRIRSPDHPHAKQGIELVIAPGPGFGREHDTTLMCLQALAATAPRDAPWRMLDFGSGSGILSIAAAKLGARVDAVEIDAAAVAHAKHNADLNGVADTIRCSVSLDQLAPDPFELVIANILRPVLLHFAPELAARVKPGGPLILSGLVATDVPGVKARYSALLRREAQVHSRGEWRAIVFWP